MVFKITPKTQFHALKEVIIISLVYMGFVYFLYINVELALFNILFLSTFGYYFIFLLLPVIILHFNYLDTKVKEVTIEENRLVINDQFYTQKDIAQITEFATYQHFNGHIGATAQPFSDYYFYVEITLKDGKKLNLSSLLGYEIDKALAENFKGINFNKINSGFFRLLMKVPANAG